MTSALCERMVSRRYTLGWRPCRNRATVGVYCRRHIGTTVEPSIGDTIERDGHEQMWDGGQWVHSPDCRCDKGAAT